MPESLRDHYNTVWQDDAAYSRDDDAGDVALETVSVTGYGKCLDVGCGNGATVRALLALGVDAYGIDISDVAVDRGNALTPGRFFRASADDMPFPDKSFDSVFLRHCDEGDDTQRQGMLAEIHRVASRAVRLIVRTGGAETPSRPSAAQWEALIAAAGFEKLPEHFSGRTFATPRTSAEEIEFVLRPADAGAAPDDSADGADEEAVLARHAASYVREGDDVVVFGPSRIRRIIDAFSRCASAGAPAAPVADVLVFANGHAGIPECLERPPTLVRPGGRALFLVTGADEIRRCLAHPSIGEWSLETQICLWGSMDTGVRFLSLADIDLAEPEFEHTRALFIYTVSPFRATKEDYCDRMDRLGLSQLAAFARGYENPWLLRALITIGLRTENLAVREQWAHHAMATYPADSADSGAAICNLLYFKDPGVSRAPRLLERARAYLEVVPAPNTTVLRWQISIAFALAVPAVAEGRHEDARTYLSYILDRDAASFSPLLLTKTTAATLLLAKLNLSRHDDASTKALLSEQYFRIVRALAASVDTAGPRLPEHYYCAEIALVYENLGLIAALARDIELNSSKPRLMVERCTATSHHKLHVASKKLAASEALLANTGIYLQKVEEARNFFYDLYMSAKAELEHGKAN